MSLNRYMWVQGNVANAVDPSGLIAEGDLSLLNQLNTCLAQSAGYQCDSPSEIARYHCLRQCAKIPELTSDAKAKILRSSIVLSFVLPTEHNCLAKWDNNQCNADTDSLGVLADPDGIWTHSHYGPRPGNQAAAQDFFKIFSAIEFRGIKNAQNDHVLISTKNEDLDYSLISPTAGVPGVGFFGLPKRLSIL